MTDLCCTDDDDRYDGEDNEDADFDDDNDDYDVLKKVSSKTVIGSSLGWYQNTHVWRSLIGKLQ